MPKKDTPCPSVGSGKEVTSTVMARRVHPLHKRGGPNDTATPIKLSPHLISSTTTLATATAEARLPVLESTKTIFWDDGGHFAQTLFESEVGVGARTVPPSRKVIVRSSAISVELLTKQKYRRDGKEEVAWKESKATMDGANQPQRAASKSLVLKYEKAQLCGGCHVLLMAHAGSKRIPLRVAEQ